MNFLILLLILFSPSVYCLSFFKPSIDISLYHNSSQIQEIIDNYIKNNSNLHKRICSFDNVNYSILDIQSRNYNATLNAVITCNVHARELFTSQVCLQFINKIVYPNDTLSHKIADEINFRIFYLGNQMRDSVLNGQYCQRTDSNNVDINRNFPTGFLGQNLGDQTNPGPFPLSQPFSKCIDKQITNNKPDIFLDIHTGEFSIYYTISDNQSTQIHATQIQILNQLVNQTCNNCMLRQDQLQGIMFVDIKIRKFVKWSNLFQIYGGFNQNLSQNLNCFTIFNPKTTSFFNFYQKRALKTMIQYFIKILQIQQNKLSN